MIFLKRKIGILIMMLILILFAGCKNDLKTSTTADVPEDSSRLEISSTPSTKKPIIVYTKEESIIIAKKRVREVYEKKIDDEFELVVGEVSLKENDIHAYWEVPIEIICEGDRIYKSFVEIYITKDEVVVMTCAAN